MSTSTVPTVISALQTMLQARAGLSGVQISQGFPLRPAAEFMAIGAADPHEQEPAGQRATPHKREENYVLGVHISVVKKGEAEADTTTARAYALAGELEDALRNDLTIAGSLGNGWAQIEGLPLEVAGPDDQGNRESIVRARVRCRARI